MARARRSVVLAYHAVGEISDGGDPHRLVLHPTRFASQLTALRRLGYTFVAARSLPKDGPPAPGTAALTFDDGWLTDAEVVAPILAKAGVTATFFVCPGWFGGQHPDVHGPAAALADERDVAALAAAGHEIGSHSSMHRDLRTLGDDELAQDLASARAGVERVSDEECSTFAYPYGLWDERVARAVMDVGHSLAFAWGGELAGWRRDAVPRMPAPPRHGGMGLILKHLGVRRRQT